MIEEIVIAIAIGGGLGNSWICALLSLGCSIEGKRSGLAFVGGRFLGLLILGAAIAGLGLVANLKPTYFLIVFGAFSIALGGYALLQALRTSPEGHPTPLHFRRGRHRGECKKELMANGGGSEEPESVKKTASYFTLGVFRGATPCLKVAILAPLLVSVDFGLAMIMVLAYAAVSTVYPIIGLLSGNLLRQTKKYGFYVRVGAAILIIILGAYFLFNALGGQAH
jgi:cytochrome c biogenesis protein CcdA